MAGGPTTPELVSAAARAGSFSALALGTTSVEDAHGQLAQINGAYGVNLFCPQPPMSESLWQEAKALAAAEGVELESPDYGFGWEEKFTAALEAANPPRVMWSMFGPFSKNELARLRARGIEAWTTVTCPEEAAWVRECDALCVQGPEAGGHRGTWAVEQDPDTRSLEELVAAVHAAVPDMPLIAAGGIRTADDVQRALSWPGVVAVSCGSAFVLSDEAGTNPANRSLIRRGGPTVSTRAFSGRYARGMETEYTRNNPQAPAIYPVLNTILGPRRAQGDEEVAYCLVGTEPEKVSGGSVADILTRLSGR